ncbi:MAG: hypothetical protein WBA23_18860 [Tunicatimonas sp.]|uniref:hypothetical protein n=1 Tax=Tunicatimonas sp. TaxID=1940096 RepID=UPI003C7755BB
METTEIRFYKLLKKYNFSDEDAGEFIGLQKEMQLQNLATKEDIAKLEIQIEKSKASILWTVVIFWLAQVGVFLGFAYKMFPGL